VPAILTHGTHGLLAPLDDHRMLAARILDLLADQNRARELARHARAVAEGCTWSWVRSGWLAAYRSLLPVHAVQTVAAGERHA
jgi:hypothetical protein